MLPGFNITKTRTSPDVLFEEIFRNNYFKKHINAYSCDLFLQTIAFVFIDLKQQA